MTVQTWFVLIEIDRRRFGSLRNPSARQSLPLSGVMKPTAEYSFPDAEVLDWRLTDDALDVQVSSVFFAGELHGIAKLHFVLLRPATAMSYECSNNKWTDEICVEPLRDICEFHHKMGKLYSLNGFGVNSGKWIAVSVHSDDAQINWE